jgi:aspartyl-tRNA(Asn)/glutamyl-tRNA(Gln) amidotransferase subunit A
VAPELSDTEMNAVPTDLADCSAAQLEALYRSAQASPDEACAAVLARIDACNAKVNAFVCVDHAGALASAASSSARWALGRPLGPLDGVPVSIKDLILTKGLPTLRGSHSQDAVQPWDVDAPATARLREAGAVILGKTTTPEFGCKGETNSPRSGITRNPWKLDRTSGGSSGGAAAAVASGMGPIAIGTDGAGSVRIPAAFCGCFGLKPSFGRIPAYPLSPFGTVAHLGPLTRTVQDAATAMNILKQGDARDWTALPPDPSDYTQDLEAGIRGLRIAYSPTLGYARKVNPEVAAAVQAAVTQLERLGAVVEQIDPGFEDPLDITTGLWFLGSWTVWNSLTPRQQALCDPDFVAQAALGQAYSALQIQQLHLRRGALGSHMRQFMKRYDLVATPAIAIPAFAAVPAGQAAMTPASMLGWTPFSYPFNLTQQPACTVPCGFTADGLPIGLQLVGPMFGDAIVLRAARAFEATRNIPTMAPTNATA